MRAEQHRSRLNIKDLADQHQCPYALVFQVPSESPMVPPATNIVWVDEVAIDPKLPLIYGKRANYETGDFAVVVIVPDRFNWYLVARETVELTTMGEFLEVEKDNVAYRVHIKKALQETETSAESGDYITPPSRTEQDQLDWLRRQFPDQDDDSNERQG
jgi:hypothetical protein